MRNILVVVYSWTGTSHRVAEALAASRHWPLAEISDARAGRTVLRCIVDSLLRRRPAIRYDGPDPGGFDAVVLVAPIWAGRLAGPMRSFVGARATSLPPAVVVVSVMDSSGAPAALVEVAQLLRRAPLLDAAFTRREVDGDACAARLDALAQNIETALKGKAQALRPAVAGITSPA
jgi:hypothetical protein